MKKTAIVKRKTLGFALIVWRNVRETFSQDNFTKPLYISCHWYRRIGWDCVAGISVSSITELLQNLSRFVTMIAFGPYGINFYL